MPAPIVSWYNADNDEQETSWDLGVVDAGSTSDEKTFLIWNNRNGDEEVSDMTNCFVTTKDSEGGNDGELVEDEWIQVQVDSMGESSFTSIGGETTKEIEAGGSDTTGNQTIAGDVNNGSYSDDEDNFCEATFRADVDPLASAGTVDFLLRVSYQYV